MMLKLTLILVSSLPLVYWHWASMDNFFRLVRRG